MEQKKEKSRSKVFYCYLTNHLKLSRIKHTYLLSHGSGGQKSRWARLVSQLNPARPKLILRFHLKVQGIMCFQGHSGC